LGHRCFSPDRNRFGHGGHDYRYWTGRANRRARSYGKPRIDGSATGSGSLILSHVNDAGFWLVKEYFGLTVVETFKSWTVMETILSVLGLILVLILSSVVH
jgi:hypothetical protein